MPAYPPLAPKLRFSCIITTCFLPPHPSHICFHIRTPTTSRSVSNMLCPCSGRAGARVERRASATQSHSSWPVSPLPPSGSPVTLKQLVCLLPPLLPTLLHGASDLVGRLTESNLGAPAAAQFLPGPKELETHIWYWNEIPVQHHSIPHKAYSLHLNTLSLTV